MSEAVLMIAATDIRGAIRDEPDLIKRIEKAFRKAQDFWMSTDEDLRFRGALAAVILETTDEAEKERVIASKRALDKFDAFLRAARSGLSVNFDSPPGEGEEFLPLMKMWHEAKDASVAGRGTGLRPS